MKKLIICLSILLGAIAPVIAQENKPDEPANEGIRFHDNEPWAQILEMASQQGKLIFIDCYTVWCGPCKGLSEDIFPKKEMGDFFNDRFICAKYDMEKGDGAMLYAKYKPHILGFPTMLFIDKDGNVVQQLAGYQEAESIIKAAEKAADGRDLFTQQKLYAEGRRDLPFLRDYMESLDAACLSDDLNKLAADYIASIEPSRLEEDEIWAMFGKYVKDVDSPAFEYLVKNAARFQHKYGRDRAAINTQIGNACGNQLRDILKINFNEDGTAQPLSTDTARAEHLISLMQRVGLSDVTTNKAKLYILKNLLNGHNDKAWATVKLFHEIGDFPFYAVAVSDYIDYLLPLTKDKKTLKDYLQVLNASLAKERKPDDSFACFKTLAKLYGRLGDKTRAAEYQKKYDDAYAKFMEQWSAYFK